MGAGGKPTRTVDGVDGQPSLRRSTRPPREAVRSKRRTRCFVPSGNPTTASWAGSEVRTGRRLWFTLRIETARKPSLEPAPAPQPGAVPSERSAGTERRRGSPKAGKPLPPASQARGSPTGPVPARQAGRIERRETGPWSTEAGQGPKAGRSEAGISRLRGRARGLGRRNVKKAGSSVSEARKCRPAPNPGQGPRELAQKKSPESSW